MFGSHLSIAGGMENALVEADELGMRCVQVFTKNQRQWQAPPLKDAQVAAWRAHQHSTGITDAVSHDSYLINLANPKPATRRKSIALFNEELSRCERLGIPHLVAHPGAHVGRGEADGLAAIADALDQLHDDLPDLSVLTCLEVTAGQGTTLGYRLEHLAAIIERVDDDDRLGVCLDTAHMLAAGYDLTSAEGAKKVLREVDDVVGLERVKVVHVNDSKVERGRRVDRHEHIGRGYIPLEAFEVVINEPRFADVPKILETPKKTSPSGRKWDAINLETLRGLMRRPEDASAAPPPARHDRGCNPPHTTDAPAP